MNIEKLIQTVPLIRLKEKFSNNQVYGLMEKFNICWSVKVKTVYWILKTAIENWQLTKDKTILEASSWNTAISLAYLANAYWFSVKIILPKTTATCKKKLIQSYGAQIIEINWTTDDCIKYRDNIYKQNPDKYFLPDQFSNYSNPQAHYYLTWKYIYQKLPDIDFFVAGLGTSWTIIWVAKYLKEKKPNIQIIAINPTDKIEGLRNFKTTNITIPFWEENKKLIDKIIDVNFQQAIEWIKLMLQEGYFVGISSWAICWWAKQYLKNKKNLKWVFIAPDGWDYYLDSLMKYLEPSMFIWCR